MSGTNSGAIRQDTACTEIDFTRAQWDPVMAIDRATWKQRTLGH
jgi:hypothetical protein